MELRSDWKEWLELLNSKNVDYVVIGAHAVAHHGHPRLTGDFDVLVKHDPKNISKLIDCLHEFGFGSLGIQASDFEGGAGLMLGHPPGRIDILTSVSGVDSEEILRSAVPGDLQGIPARFMSLDCLLRNKLASGRVKDEQDARILQRLQEEL